MPKKRAAIYARLSRDPEGTKTSIARQVADCETLARRKRWGVAEVFRDNDRSATNGKRRPGWERMLAGLEAGAFDAVLAYSSSRMYRRPADLERLIELTKERGVEVATVASGRIDLDTADGRMLAGILASIDQGEAERTGERVRNAKAAAARAGRPSGGGKRPFGYKAGGMEVEPTEAEELRRAVAEVLAGRSLRSVVIDWNARGVTSTRGGAWRVSTLRRVLQSPRIAGLRAYKGSVIGEAAWPAIIDRADHERLVAMLRDPDRRKSTTTARRYLLSGLAHCEKCGHPLVAAPSPRGRSYACKRDPGRRDACGGVRIDVDELDGLVAEAVLIALHAPGLTKARKALRRRGPGADLARQLRDDEAGLERLSTDHYVDQRISRREFLAARDALAKRIEDARKALARETSDGVVASLPGGDLREWWAEADLERRRALIAAVTERVEVAPIGRGQRSRERPDRVSITWRA